MAIAGHGHEETRSSVFEYDSHEQEIVMPGFRFHPTEEELIEFYLRRKVQGKGFLVDLIPFLDLYRFDPWELPAMAAIGEKEWFFYVPRDRKYRNGDRPNRVTTSGYWKATGADRTVHDEGSRPIGLKKTLVFYTGKAPRGTRSSWAMNEYRLRQDEAGPSHNKTEISLCRIYKRPALQNYRHRPSSMTSKAESSLTPTTTGEPLSSPPFIMNKPNELGRCINKEEAVHLFSSIPAGSPRVAPLTEEEYQLDPSSLPAVDDLNKMISFLDQPRLLPLQCTSSYDELWCRNSLSNCKDCGNNFR
ncbi:hypothetical protein HPP92_004206 [Vanilla planifolia]|uniref:NAC domain-containing protein n=1 Tax=Vanilla planifolia TaxID=51239 RepID=A0A835RWA0_VANPL|nr:hypothetical protein HPP92_004206 [Vanilla planifolia]